MIPCYPSGIIYDLFDCLLIHLENSGHIGIPFYFLSPVADQSLAYSNILAEWLTQSKQNKVYLAEEPFPHAMMVRLGRLKHFPGVYCEAFSNEFRSPCVVFTGHPSLRFGDVVHFVQLWRSSPNNLIVFTEPDFQYMEALLPYQPLSMKVAYCPIDTALSFGQINKLLREFKPSTLLIPQQYSQPPVHQKHRNDLMIDVQGEPIKLMTYKHNETVKIALKSNYEKLTIDGQISEQLKPAEIKPGCSIATITGALVARDNKFHLSSLTQNEIKSYLTVKPGQSLPPLTCTWGSLDLVMMMQKLTNAGIYDTSVEQTSNGCIVHLVSIFISHSSTIYILDS